MPLPHFRDVTTQPREVEAPAQGHTVNQLAGLGLEPWVRHPCPELAPRQHQAWAQVGDKPCPSSFLSPCSPPPPGWDRQRSDGAPPATLPPHRGFSSAILAAPSYLRYSSSCPVRYGQPALGSPSLEPAFPQRGKECSHLPVLSLQAPNPCILPCPRAEEGPTWAAGGGGALGRARQQGQVLCRAPFCLPRARAPQWPFMGPRGVV